MLGRLERQTKLAADDRKIIAAVNVGDISPDDIRDGKRQLPRAGAMAGDGDDRPHFPWFRGNGRGSFPASSSL
jgi:hypothetical protein